MADTKQQDLSALVSKILEHPELVSQITGLLAESAPSENESPPITETAAPPAQPIETPISAEKGKQENRKKLLAALRPFLSERRRGALDSLETAATLFEITKA